VKKDRRPHRELLVAAQEQRGGFRRDLIDLLHTRNWICLPDETMAEVAAGIGVTEAVLREAEVVARRRNLTLLSNRLPSDRCPERMQRLVMPAQVMADFQATAAQFSATPCSLLRSIIHHVLSRPPHLERTRLLELERKWIYQGKVYVVYVDPKHGGKKWSYGATATITHGAYVALRNRAKNLGVSISAVLREAVVDLLEAKLDRLQMVPSVDHMWNDPARYWVGKKEKDDALE
jgi:hypothetical protein